MHAITKTSGFANAGDGHCSVPSIRCRALFSLPEKGGCALLQDRWSMFELGSNPAATRGQSLSALPLISDVDLLGDSQGIVYLNTQIPNGPLNFPVIQKQLHGPQIARAAASLWCSGVSVCRRRMDRGQC